MLTCGYKDKIKRGTRNPNGLEMYLMARAARTIPIGTVYPVWTGIGAVGAVIIGIVFFNEPATFRRMFFITTLILSIIGLKVF